MYKSIRFIVALAFMFALASLSTLASGDEDGRKNAAHPFEPAEHLVYEGEFSKFLLRGIKIAEFSFTSTHDNLKDGAPNSSSESTHLALVGDVKSEGWFHKLFNLEFHFRLETLVERDTFSVLKSTKLDEQGKRIRTSEAVFDHKAKQVQWTEINPKDPQASPRVVNSPLEGHVHDIMSAIYFLRTQPLEPGKRFEISLSDSGQVYPVPITVVAEPKRMKTVLGKVPVVRLDVELFGEARAVEGDGRMSIWMTTDARRIPVRGRVSTDLGTIDIKLKKYSNDLKPATQK